MARLNNIIPEESRRGKALGKPLSAVGYAVFRNRHISLLARLATSQPIPYNDNFIG